MYVNLRCDSDSASPSTETEEAVPDLVYVCTLCNHSLPGASGLPRHMRVKHQTTVSEGSYVKLSLGNVIAKCTQESFEGTYFKCLQCGAYIMHTPKVAVHVRITPERTLSCKTRCPKGIPVTRRLLQIRKSRCKDVLCLECGKILQGKLSLRRHMLACHTKQCDEQGMMLLCPECGHTFTNQSCFRKHMQLAHTKEKYGCALCGFMTHNKKYLEKHTEIHLRPSPCPRPFICDECGHNFITKNHLSAHKTTHGPRKHKCPICPKTFVRPQELKKHQLTHTGMHPFICQECGKAFTRDCNLKIHMRIHTGEKPYQCSLCDAAFAQKNSLNVHMKKHEKLNRM